MPRRSGSAAAGGCCVDLWVNGGFSYVSSRTQRGEVSYLIYSHTFTQFCPPRCVSGYFVVVLCYLHSRLQNLTVRCCSEVTSSLLSFPIPIPCHPHPGSPGGYSSALSTKGYHGWFWVVVEGGRARHGF